MEENTKNHIASHLLRILGRKEGEKWEVASQLGYESSHIWFA